MLKKADIKKEVNMKKYILVNNMISELKEVKSYLLICEDFTINTSTGMVMDTPSRSTSTQIEKYNDYKIFKESDLKKEVSRMNAVDKYLRSQELKEDIYYQKKYIEKQNKELEKLNNELREIRKGELI